MATHALGPAWAALDWRPGLLGCRMGWGSGDMPRPGPACRHRPLVLCFEPPVPHNAHTDTRMSWVCAPRCGPGPSCASSWPQRHAISRCALLPPDGVGQQMQQGALITTTLGSQWAMLRFTMQLTHVPSLVPMQVVLFTAAGARHADSVLRHIDPTGTLFAHRCAPPLRCLALASAPRSLPVLCGHLLLHTACCF